MTQHEEHMMKLASNCTMTYSECEKEISRAREQKSRHHVVGRQANAAMKKWQKYINQMTAVASIKYMEEKSA